MVNTKLKRAKVLSFFLSIFVLILTGCEGFFTDNGLDEKIRAAIDYANAPTSSFWISGDQTMGTITPYGKISYKPTDYQNIKFKLKPEYEFLGWNFRYEEIQSGEKYTREITNKNWWKDYIEIVNEEISEPSTTGEITYSLQLKFIKAEENMLIEPMCGKKPLVTEWKPTDDRAGVSSQTPIYITFDSEILKDSLKDSITILVDGSDYTDYFTAPDIETVDSGSKQYSRISLTPKEVLPCPDDESKTAVVTIKLTDAIKTTQGVSLTPVQYTYRINSKPLSYSYVDMSDYNVQEGQTIPNTSPLQFAIAKYISLSFKENNGYQFLYWTTNNDNIKFAEDDVTLNPTSFYTMTLINETEKAKISPVCAPRPKLKESDFNNKYSGHLNPRDSDIILTFDKNIVIPDDAKFTITCTGKGDVSSSFNAPVASGNTIQISAKKDSNRIEVKTGDALTVTISIPDSLYYVYHDEKTNHDINITIGKNAQEFQPEYKIDSSTQDSANVTFVSTLNDKTTGTILIDNIKNDDKVHEYDIDKEVILNFRPNDDYEFLYWTTSNNNVAIKDIFSASTALTVKESGVCTVTAKCTPKLKVKLVQPAEAINPCDSDIKLEFNLPPENFTTDGKIGNSLNSISVSYNGSDVMSTCYETPKIEGNYLIIKSKKKLSVPQGATNGVVVKIDGTFHYNYTDKAGVLTETKKIYLADGVYSGSFSVNEKTQKQICVKINVDSNHMQLNTEPFESYKDNSSVYKLNENTEYDLSFTSNENWQFVKWNISGLDETASDSPVSITKTTQFGVDYYKLIVKTAKDGVGTSTNPIIISDDSASRLTAELTAPASTGSVERDSTIKITFNNKPDDSIKQKIQILIDGISVADNFKLNEATFEGNVLTILPDTNNRISVSEGSTRKVKVIIPSDAYYKYPESNSSNNITCGKDYSFDYVINHETISFVNVSYKVKDKENEVTAGTILCDTKTINANTTNEVDRRKYYMDSGVHTLTFNENPDYQFLYWKTDVENAIVFNPNTSKTSKTIQFTVQEPSSAVNIIAYCAPRLKVNSITPQNKDEGVERDNDIKVTFNINPDESIKNKIRITCDGNSILSNFNESVISEKVLTIKADPLNKIPVPSNAKKTVTVIVPADSYYKYTALDNTEYYITLGNDYSYDYKIKEKTLKQATGSFKVYVGETMTSAGTIKCDGVDVTGGTFEYNMDSVTRTLSFTEGADYQFLYWEVSDTDAINMTAATQKDKQTTFIPADSGSNIQIKAVCAPRLKLDLSKCLPSSAEGGVYSDSNIILLFNKAADIDDLRSAISISCGSVNVKDNFPIENWTLEEENSQYKLTIPASTSNRITVPAGSTKKVTVTVPADTSYSYKVSESSTETFDVSCGKSQNFEYKINSKTKQTAKVLFQVVNGDDTNNVAGEIRLNGVIPDTTNNQYIYNMDGISRTLTFTEKEGYQFLYWESSNNDIINISTSNFQNKISAFTPSGTGTSETQITVTIKAICVPKLTATIEPVNTVTNGQPVPVARDSDIVINFSNAPDSSIKSKIKITCDGSSVNNNFDISNATFSGAGKTLTIKSILTNRIPVPAGTTKTVRVEIFSSAYYTCTKNSNNYDVTYGGPSEFEYVIDDSTGKKAKVKFAVYDESGSLCNNGGIISWNNNEVTNTSYISFNIDSTQKSISFNPSDDYKFKQWIVTNSNTNSIVFGDANTSNSNFTIKDEDNSIIIKAIVQKRYRVAEFTPADTEGGVPCDSSIKLKFNWDVNTRWASDNPLDGINIKLGNTSIMDCFNTQQVYYDRENLTLEIKSKYDGSFNKYFTSSYLTVTVTIGTPLVDIPEEHTYLINRETEKIPPKLEEVYVYKDSESSETCILSDYVNYATGTDAVENIKKNIVNRLYISACAWDEESGLKSFIIKEQLIRSVEGNEITNSEIYTTTAINFYSGTTYADIDEWLCGDNFYEFKSLQDGVVRIELILEDLFGNTTSQSFEVIKDSIITPIELTGVGSLQPYNGSTYTYKYDQSPVEFDNSKNYKNIVLAKNTVKDIVATTMDGTQLYKANTEIDANKIGSILIDDVYVKRGINGAYVKASDCGTNVTDNINTFIPGNEDFYSTSISKIYNIPQRCCVMFIEPSMDEDIYVKYKTKDSFGNEEDCSFVIPHIIRVDSSIYLSSTGNIRTAEISVSESGSTETPVYVYYRTGSSSSWVNSYINPSPLDSGNTVKLMTNKNNVNQDFSNVQFVAVTEFNRFYKSEDVFVHQNYTSTNTSLFTGDVPYVDDYVTKPGPANSGYHQVNVYFDPENYVDSSYSYSLLLDPSFSGNTLTRGKKYDIPKITDGSLTHLGNVSFKVASENTYEMQMAIINSDNEIVYHGTDESVNDYWEVNCSYDNIKPMIRNFGSTVYDAKSNGYLNFNNITENNPLEYNGQAFFYYALTDTKLSENNFGNEESKRMCWYKPGSNIKIPFYNKNANYLCVQLIDANGNTNYYTKALNIRNYSYDESSQISIKNIIKNDDDSSTITVNNPEGVTCELYRSNSSADDWDKLSTMTYDSENKVSTYTISYMNNNCCYIKPFTSRFYTGPQLYFYPKGYTQEIICNKKSVYDINGIMTILCDQPTLVHTLISQKNYGSDIDKWELYGGVLNEKQVHSTTSYPAADDISINEGDYYIVVAYFSDGTRLTSKVHQK